MVGIENIHEAVKQMRTDTFEKSSQISIGDTISILKNIQKGDREKEPYVRFDFGYFEPIDIHSYRGFYDELALSYGNKSNEVLLSGFIKMLEDAVGKTFTGWKGGDYTMTKDTPLWVANSGEANETAVVGVIDDGFRVIIETRYIEG
jgi:hypothetical protein